jgi:hypothetical protein
MKPIEDIIKNSKNLLDDLDLLEQVQLEFDRLNSENKRLTKELAAARYENFFVYSQIRKHDHTGTLRSLFKKRIEHAKYPHPKRKLN